jgi:anaerobic magnesium-protoporphyrin IX monomethyl ester cyclase
MNPMVLDAVIISDSGADSMSSTNPLRLTLDGRIADIQVAQNYLAHGGRVQLPIDGDDQMSWASAPKLNGIYLFNYLTKNNYQVALIDTFNSEKDRFKQLLDHHPRVVIISTTFIPGKQNLIKLVTDIRKLAPEVFVIAGGPMVYTSYLMLKRTREPDYDTRAATNEFLFLDTDNEPAVDLYIISLRGEQLLCDILDRFQQNREIDDIPNCARLIDNNYHFTERVDDINSSEDFSVDWQALPDDVFSAGVVPMQASNGCPFECAFCNFTKDRRLTWVKSTERIVAEMKAVQERGARYVWFVDDNFRLGKSDLEAVCSRLIDERLELNWMTFVRASTLDHINTDLLRQAGCIEVQLGLESADPLILKNMNKKASPELYGRVLRKLLRSGINCSCYFIFGFPGETEESARHTLDFIKSFEDQPHEGSLSWSMFPFTLIPLSPVYEPGARKKYGITGYLHKWQHATMNSDQARDQLFRTFSAIEKSGPIYRGDNQEIFRRLGSSVRKKFETTRHKLSKMALSGKLEKENILQSFRQVLPRSKDAIEEGNSDMDVGREGAEKGVNK